MKSSSRHIIQASISGMCVFLLCLFIAAVKPACSQDLSLFSFGKGKIQVRLYADYFCGPCSRLEPKIEPLISELVKKDVITISFIDAPFHKHSTMYAQYFLYGLDSSKNIDQAIRIRRALFEASKLPIEDQGKLESFLVNKGISFTKFDEKPVFYIFQNFFREDRITSTPSCVIVKDGQKKHCQRRQRGAESD
ncbi:MAG TPA: thioredoxin domain-containing protein [Syntrophorhabdaceae bacterium]|nr:thioredoxin domain-containing protein [Syntrophorhabdaceae bacterium]